ncbi:hypothetical protein [Clostridium sp. 1001271B_151109_B4]|uniref:hypothetical protein n=1 Tax=Clostridium sp. 1001271B_151109_B4 TaxID=2787148 RepID=UPI0018A97E2B|nr:hypothetical protein [Clostridium sp. 1001271B_151109_B4]
MEVLLVMLLIFAFGAIIFSIITYVFMGLSLSGAAELEGIDKKWFAWIPILNMFILLKVGNKDVRYTWVFVGVMLASFLTEFNDNGFLILINLALIIWSIVIQIQSYLVISNKYQVKPAWFIVGIFITPILLVAYILLYNKVKRCKEVRASLK